MHNSLKQFCPQLVYCLPCTLKNRQNLIDNFTCVICMSTVHDDARMCNQCSKLYCLNCITQWVLEEQSSCPNCRTTVKLEELAYCRWAKDVTALIENLPNQLHSTVENRISETNPTWCNDHENNNKMKCATHKDKMSVFCETCSAYLCHKCMCETGHFQHSFLPLEFAYEPPISDDEGNFNQDESNVEKLVFQLQEMGFENSYGKLRSLLLMNNCLIANVVDALNIENIIENNLELHRQKKSNLEESICQLKEMGYDNSNGRLRTLLIMSGCSLEKVFELLSTDFFKC
ncbi:E3 ubiquitin-protein ligase TRIM37 isoform X1 [Hydra vulgaris]|uniref:E3 ubiquitin-protein ligase TRIM37 isoform X1 n=2 Tax=Hydra vulgaris TaxID=6087 RepID=UPI001F5EC917|nr:E3 ubiquitin-protein ligase TRIM37 isoform X2 [Hydra vulgaris]